MDELESSLRLWLLISELLRLIVGKLGIKSLIAGDRAGLEVFG